MNKVILIILTITILTTYNHIIFANNILNQSNLVTTDTNEYTNQLLKNDIDNERKIDINKISDMDYNEETLSELFDGIKSDTKNEYIHLNYNTYQYNPKDILIIPKIRKTVNIPLPQLENRAILNGNEKEKEVIEKAFELIKDCGEYGNILYSMKDRIDVLWGNRFEYDGSHAESVPPTKFLFWSEKGKITLNKKDKDIFSTPEYLAIILAHELSHQFDYQYVGNTNKEIALKYISEEKAYLTQIYIYEILNRRYPYLFDRSKIKYEKALIFIDEQSFFKAMWDYKNNNGKYLNENDFPRFNKDSFNKNFYAILDKYSSEYLEKIDFKGGYTFHGFITVTYDDIKDDPIHTNLKWQNIYDRFFKVRDYTITNIYKRYCKTRGVTPQSDNVLMSKLLPDSIDPWPLNEWIDAQTQQGEDHNNNQGEIGIDPGEPPSPIDYEPNWDGR